MNYLAINDAGGGGGRFDGSSLGVIESGITGFRFRGAEVSDLFDGSGGLGLNAIIFFFAGMALLIYLVFGGFQVMTAGSSPDKAAAGKSKVTNALVGFFIIFIAFWVVQLAGLIFGLEGIATTFGG